MKKASSLKYRMQAKCKVLPGENGGVKPNKTEQRGYIISVLPFPLSVNVSPKRAGLPGIVRDLGTLTGVHRPPTENQLGET